MKEIITDVFVANLPQIVDTLFLILAYIVTRKLIPLIKTKIDENKLNDILHWCQVFVESAQRLDKSGKLEGLSKKEYVMNELNNYIANKGYQFTDEQLQNIRRAAVLTLENTEALINQAKTGLKGDTNEKVASDN